MQGDRFTLVDMPDGNTAIYDLTKPEGHEQIIILLPVYIWALEPLVALMNELERKANE